MVESVQRRMCKLITNMLNYIHRDPAGWNVNQSWQFLWPETTKVAVEELVILNLCHVK